MVKVVNSAQRHVWLTLTSGQTLRLAPGEISPDLEDVEIVNNPMVQKLQDQRVIDIYKVEESGGRPARPASEADTPTRARTKKTEPAE